MRQWVLTAGASDVTGLQLREVNRPEPGAEQVLLRVDAVSINARDRMILAGPFGRTPGLEFVPLSDVAGVVEAVGRSVEGWGVGDRVMTAHVPTWRDGPPPSFGTGPGSFEDPGVAAEHVLVDADRLLRTPEALTSAEASTLQVAGVTAWNALFGAHPVGRGDVLVVTGSGGVALYAAQLARAAEARLVVAVRSRDRVDPRWSALEPELVVGTEHPGWGQEVFDRFGGVAKVVNSVGGVLLGESLLALGNGGEVAVPGLIDVRPTEVDLLGMIGRQASLRGVAVGSVRMHEELARFLTDHGVHPIIDREVPFERLPDAYAALEGSGVFGKVVIRVAA